jgi:molecular chaperone Hsp33
MHASGLDPAAKFTTMLEEDSFRRFLFEDSGVRGEIVRLDNSWKSVLERHPYPNSVSTQLGQALAAVLLLSATIKFKGALILQAQSEGPLHTLVVQATDQRAVRGIAHWRGDVPVGPLPDVFGPGRLVFTIQNEGAEPYQAVIDLEGDTLASAIEQYFARSEQLATRLWLAADEHHAAGLFLQELPASHREPDDWTRVTMLADTVTDGELLTLPSARLLYRLFNEERVRLFEPEAVTFRCTCSRDRIERVLLAVGRSELEDILDKEKTIEVHCDFCNRLYQFDAVDIGSLFADDHRVLGSVRRH